MVEIMSCLYFGQMSIKNGERHESFILIS